MSVRAIYFEERNIGEHIKKSKKQFIWKFELDGLQHTIEFLVSKLTGKKKVIQDGIVLLEQKKLTKSFEFPFNISKHMLVIKYGLKGSDLRIDNNIFENLYQGKSFGDKTTAVPAKSTGPARSQTQYTASKKVSDGWGDIKKAKDNVKYDDIPDPYDDVPIKVKEEIKEKVSLESVGNRRKTGTVVQKSKNTEFFDQDNDNDFDWGDSKVRFNFLQYNTLTIFLTLFSRKRLIRKMMMHLDLILIIKLLQNLKIARVHLTLTNSINTYLKRLSRLIHLTWEKVIIKEQQV
jgi:hypothetical protein